MGINKITLINTTRNLLYLLPKLYYKTLSMMHHLIQKHKDRLLIIGLVLHVVSYFIPFFAEGVGWRFFKAGIMTFLDGNVMNGWYLYYFFFFPLIFLPWLLRTIIPQQKYKHYNQAGILFFFGIALPVLLSLGLVLYDIKRLWNDSIIGYACWVSSYIIFCTIFVQRYFYEVKEENDISKHLVDNE